MATARIRRQRAAALAAVAGAHAGLFVLLAIGLRAPVPPPERQVAVIPVYLVEARRPARAVLAVPDRPRAPTVRPRPAVELPAMPATPAPQVAEPVAAATESDADRARLAGALRASRVGCANPSLLTERERIRCEARLAAGAADAKYIPTPLPPERRAYYDAVARARQPGRPAPMIPYKTPPPTAGTSGSLAALQTKNDVQIPLVGCKLGMKQKPNSLKLGPLPCFISPPQSPLAPDVDIQNPDKVVKGKD